MSYFLGIFPSNESNYLIRKLVRDLGRVFEGQEVDVRWGSPEKYHISLIYLGNSVNILKRAIIVGRLKRLKKQRFRIRFEKSVVGISRSYKGLIYLTVDEGGEALRDLVLELRQILRINDSNLFIPHLTLGRVSKELTEQEYKNLLIGVREINKLLHINNICIDIKEINLLMNDQDSIKSFKNFSLT